jgi:tetratricopeptide (TPR) repeat protein
MLVFLRTFDWNLSREIHFRSLADTFTSIVRGAAFLFLGRGGVVRRAIRGRREGCDSAGERATYQEGLSALQQGDLVAARAAFERVLRLMPQSPEGHNSLGWVLFAQNEVDAAIAHYRTALKWRPEFVQAHINLANALVQKGDLAAALREAREGARVGPGDSEAHRTVGGFEIFQTSMGLIREMRRPSN